MKHNREYFDSDEEFMFYCWLLEAKQVGIIEEFYIKPVTYNIFERVPYTYLKTSISKIKKMRTVKEKEGTLLHPWSYTPDFLVVGDLSIFHTGTHKITHPIWKEYKQSYVIDTKGTGANHGDDKKFPLIQKALWHSKGIYANKLVPKYFFKNAWLPMPVLKEKDLVWTNQVKLKSGKVKEQLKRSAFRKCMTFKEKYDKGLIEI